MSTDMETQIPEASGSSRNPGVTGPQMPPLDDHSRGSERLKDEGQLDCDCGVSVRTRQARKKRKLIPAFGRLVTPPCCVKVVAPDGSTSGMYLFYSHKSSPLTDCWGRCMGCAKSLLLIQAVS